MPSHTSIIDEILGSYPADPASLIMVLQDIQAKFNHVPPEAFEPVAAKLGITQSRVYSAATFYKAFSLEPKGEHQIDVCMGTACHVRGAQRLLHQLSDELGIPEGGTTDDLNVSLSAVHCVGACALGPVVIIDGEVHGDVKPAKLTKAVSKARSGQNTCSTCSEGTKKSRADAITAALRPVHSADELALWRTGLQHSKNTEMATISICSGSGCRALGSQKLIDALESVIAEKHLGDKVKIQNNGCHGFCERGLIAVIRPQGLFYQNATAADAVEIIEKTIENGEVIDRLLYRDDQNDQLIVLEKDVPFYAKQNRQLMSQNALIDPIDINGYVEAGGYQAVATALTSRTPEAVIEEVTTAGLRGRGGGGFPAARKWASARKVAADKKYILCNADEGDPGAFMDCSLLEGNPHSVIEGLIIGAYAVAGGNSAAEGYVYVRAEYPVAVAHLEIALEQARTAGLLGKNILGTDFSYDIQISRGGGSFVCGESTALMASIEGNIGEPRAKYVHTSTAGLWAKPTVLNNVETWANVPLIINNGAQAFAAIGTKRSSGTKIFSLVGKVKNTGLVEVPMGMTLREIVFVIGGGLRDGGKFKAVQTGGPSGGCLPESALDTAVDFDELTKTGSMMGSGGMIVMDEKTCMVDVARYFTEFLADESCGKCAACRLGVDQMKQILDRICNGEGTQDDIPALEKLFNVLDDGALCGLGKSAANPVRSTLKYFRDEYDAHINNKKCPAGVCQSLITYHIDETCTGCQQCIKVCPVDAISGEKKGQHTIDVHKCDSCGICVATCKFDSIIKV